MLGEVRYQLDGRPLWIDRLANPPQPLSAARVRIDEVLPRRDDVGRIGAHLRHVLEMDAIGIGPEPGRQRGDLGCPDHHQDRLGCRHPLPDEGERTRQELIHP